jgi:hypothetical protein
MLEQSRWLSLPTGRRGVWAVVLLGGCVTLALGLLGVRAYNHSAEKASDTAGTAQGQPADADVVEIRGRVVDPEDRPVAGAEVVLVLNSPGGAEKEEPLARLLSGALAGRL